MSDDPSDPHEDREDAGFGETPEFRFPAWLEARTAERRDPPPAPVEPRAKTPPAAARPIAPPASPRTRPAGARAPEPPPLPPPAPGPPRRPAGAPVREHTPEVEAWVARFRDPSGPPRIGSRVLVSGPPPSALDRAPAAEPGAAPPPGPRRPAAPRRAAPRRRRIGPSVGARRTATAAAAVLLVACAGLVLTVATRSLLRSRSSASRAPALAAVPAETPRSPVAPIRAVTVPVIPASRPSPPAAVASPGGTEPAPAVVRYGIEAATFLFEDLALEARDSLAGATGRGCRVRHSFENGAPVYRVVIGPLESRDEAESLAADLFARGLVREARVVRWRGAGRARP